MKKAEALAGTSKGRRNDERKTKKSRDPVTCNRRGGEAVSVTQETRPRLKTRCVRAEDKKRGVVLKTKGERNGKHSRFLHQIQPLPVDLLLTCRLSPFIRFIHLNKLGQNISSSTD